MHEPQRARPHPTAERRPAPHRPARPAWQWLLAVVALVALVVIGVVAYLMPPAENDGSSAAESVAPSSPSVEAGPGGQPPGEGAPDARPGHEPVPDDAPEVVPSPDPAHPEIDRREPPPPGVCIRLDGWRPNLAEAVDCADEPPVYQVLWSGPNADQPPVRCHFGYSYQAGADQLPERVCLFPRLITDACYSIPVNGPAEVGADAPQRTTDDVAESLNATAIPVACDAPPRMPHEVVVRMLGEIEGTDPHHCPAGLRYYLEDDVNSRLACLATT